MIRSDRYSAIFWTKLQRKCAHLFMTFPFSHSLFHGNFSDTEKLNLMNEQNCRWMNDILLSHENFAVIRSFCESQQKFYESPCWIYWIKWIFTTRTTPYRWINKLCVVFARGPRETETPGPVFILLLEFLHVLVRICIAKVHAFVIFFKRSAGPLQYSFTAFHLNSEKISNLCRMLFRWCIEL